MSAKSNVLRIEKKQLKPKLLDLLLQLAEKNLFFYCFQSATIDYLNFEPALISFIHKFLLCVVSLNVKFVQASSWIFFACVSVL